MNNLPLELAEMRPNGSAEMCKGPSTLELIKLSAARSDSVFATAIFSACIFALGVACHRFYQRRKTGSALARGRHAAEDSIVEGAHEQSISPAIACVTPTNRANLVSEGAVD